MFVKPGKITDPVLLAEPHIHGELLAVRVPHTYQRLPDSGQEVPDNDPHWLRLLRDGDVVLAEPVHEKVGELVADGQEHTATIEGDHPAAPAVHEGATS